MLNQNVYNLANFISSIKGKKEIGLVVAENQKEFETFKQDLINLEFKESKILKDLFLNTQTFFHLNNDCSLEIIKFIRDYKLGAIALKSKTSDKFKWYYPDYSKSCLILIITNEELDKFNKLDIYEYATTVYRNLKVQA